MRGNCDRVADFDLDQRTPGRAIYTDVLAKFVIWWPASINLGLAIALLAATLAAAVVARRRLFFRFKWRILLAVAVPFLAGACSCATSASAGDGDPQSASRVGCVLVLAACGRLRDLPVYAAGSVRLVERLDGGLAFWNALGVAVAWFVPGASFLLILPGAVAAVGGLAAAFLPEHITLRGVRDATCLAAIAAGVLWLPMQVLLYDAIGFQLTPVYVVSAALVTLTALPLLGTGSDFSDAPVTKPASAQSVASSSLSSARMQFFSSCTLALPLKSRRSGT